MQEYRSGHNEAVLETVRPKATGVRIPLPAPNKNTHRQVGIFISCGERREAAPTSRAQWVGVRIRRAEIDELARQAKRECIFIKDEYPSSMCGQQVGIFISCGEWREAAPTSRAEWVGVRIRRAEIGELARQAKRERIFIKYEYPSSLDCRVTRSSPITMTNAYISAFSSVLF